jgi:dTDP-4-amino-4,6-dideoxygalactose transaminase
MKIQFLNLEPVHKQIKSQMQLAFEDVYDSNWFVLGKKLEFFETLYSNFNNVNFTVGVSNGLDALHLSLKIAGIEAGDEVIVPSNTYIATWLSVSFLGAIPVPVEPNMFTYNIDPAKIEAEITSKTKAIMPVHLYGQACDMETIMTLSKKYNIKIIEDNAQSQGATCNGIITGSFGDINATSFYPGKNLGALGDAGAITTNNEIYAKKAKILRNYGSETKYHNDEIGYNMRLDELQAAFLSVKLNYIEEWTKQRQQVASWYNELLCGVGDLILPQVAKNCTHVYHLYVIRTNQRDRLQQYLLENGIGTLIHYPIPPHLQVAYKDSKFLNKKYHIAEDLANTSLSLPLYPGLEYSMVEYVSEKIRLFFR